MDKYLDDETERKTWLMATQDLSHELDDKDEIDKTQELSSPVKIEYKLRQSHHSNLKHKRKQKQKRKLKSNIQEYNITTRILCTSNSRIYKIYKNLSRMDFKVTKSNGQPPDSWKRKTNLIHMQGINHSNFLSYKVESGFEMDRE